MGRGKRQAIALTLDATTSRGVLPASAQETWVEFTFVQANPAALVVPEVRKAIDAFTEGTPVEVVLNSWGEPQLSLAGVVLGSPSFSSVDGLAGAVQRRLRGEREMLLIALADGKVAGHGVKLLEDRLLTVTVRLDLTRYYRQRSALSG
jgi:hypothetical protein